MRLLPAVFSFFDLGQEKKKCGGFLIYNTITACSAGGLPRTVTEGERLKMLREVIFSGISL